MSLLEKLRPHPMNPVYRLGMCSIMTSMMAWKKLHLPSSLLPKKLKAINDLWTDDMMRNIITSFATKYPMDEFTKLKMPKSFAPKVKVASKYRLSEAQIKNFYLNGYLEPFDLFSEKEMVKFRDRALELRKTKSKTYGFPCDRDRHLEWPQLMKIMAHPAIVERLAQLLGPDLLAWRSQFFYKPPTVGGRVGWHQATTYWFESSFSDKVMIPRDTSELFQLTVWIPCDPATLKSGCMQFVRGSLLEDVKWLRLGGDVGFHAVKYFLEYEVDPSRGSIR